jgi:LexA-binding, inner membrane-associated putative hydrolase
VRIDPGNTRFVPLDLEYFPWSHSLLTCVVWATAFALIYHLVAHYWQGTVAIWIGVLSHWVLDWITHRPDMPLYPGGQRFGLGLWNSVPGTMAVEIAMLVLGVWLYVRATKPLDRIGRYAFAVYVTVLSVLYVADYFGSPPSGTSDIIWSGIPFELVALVWAWWFDRHRVPLDSSQQ